MPIQIRTDKNGTYFRYGQQAKYYFNPASARSVALAYRKALAQSRAIQVSQHGGLTLTFD